MTRTWDWKDVVKPRKARQSASQGRHKRQQTEPLATVAMQLRTLSDAELRSVSAEAGVTIYTLRDWCDGYVANGRADTVYRVQQALASFRGNVVRLRA